MNVWVLVSLLLGLALIVSIVGDDSRDAWKVVERLSRHAGSGELRVPVFMEGIDWVGTATIRHNRLEAHWFGAPTDGVVTGFHCSIGAFTFRATFNPPQEVHRGYSCTASQSGSNEGVAYVRP